MVLAVYPLRLFKRGLDKPPEGSADVSSDPVTSSAPLDLKVAKPNAAGVSAGAEEQDERMDTQTQWDRVSRVVEDGIQKAKEIEALHQAAGRQMDAVDYAYERMLLELSEVLPDINENRSVCRANRDQAYAEAAVAYAADLAKEVAEQLGEKLADTDEPAERKPGKKKAQSETVAA